MTEEIIGWRSSTAYFSDRQSRSMKTLFIHRPRPLFGLDAASAAPRQWRVPMPGSMAVSESVVAKDLVLDGNLGRDVLSHWLVTLDLAAGRGWIGTIAPQPT